MNLHAKLLEREAAGNPVTVGVIGADYTELAVRALHTAYGLDAA